MVDALGCEFRRVVKLEKPLGQTMKRPKYHIRDLKFILDNGGEWAWKIFRHKNYMIGSGL